MPNGSQASSQSLTPEALSLSRRQLLQELGPTDFQVWRHHPITAAFLQYLADQVAYYREGLADLAELGCLDPMARPETQNPNVLRGRLLMLRELADIKVEAIQAFYAEDTQEDDQ